MIPIPLPSRTLGDENLVQNAKAEIRQPEVSQRNLYRASGDGPDEGGSFSVVLLILTDQEPVEPVSVAIDRADRARLAHLRWPGNP